MASFPSMKRPTLAGWKVVADNGAGLNAPHGVE